LRAARDLCTDHLYSMSNDAPSPASDLDEVLGPGLRELLAVFARDLAAVAFPDVDHQALAQQVALLGERAAEVRRVEAALAEARTRLADAHDQLVARGQRALAYARIYAEDHPALAARLEAITLPRPRGPRPVAPTSTEAPRPRGRPRKVAVDETTLFAEPVRAPEPPRAEPLRVVAP
jgi:ElaB/YqjD/DUF883 family membrane-anchored ribosome-binding protein